MDDPIDVVVFLNGAGETSIPLEVASTIDAKGIRVHVCSLFKPDEKAFDIDVNWLGARSQLDPRAYYRLGKFVRRVGADIVHIHPNVSGSIARLLLALEELALVTTEHNTHEDFGRVKRLINGLTNPLNHIVVANSETTKRSFARWEKILLSNAGTNVQIVHNGVDIKAVEDGQAAGEVPPLPDGFLIGTAGRQVPQKNQAALIRAAAPLINEYEDVHLVFIGKGELESDLQALAETKGIAEETHFLGYLPKRNDVYAVMSEFDLFGFPSAYEGFGVAVAEAMAVGIPVVANDISVLREVVGDAGVLIDVENTETFTEAMDALIQNEGRRRALATAGQERIERYFTLERTVDKHVELYKKLGETKF